MRFPLKAGMTKDPLGSRVRGELRQAEEVDVALGCDADGSTEAFVRPFPPSPRDTTRGTWMGDHSKEAK